MPKTGRDRPYSQFNFQLNRVTATDNQGPSMNSEEIIAGFQEVSGLGMDTTVAEYRAGNSRASEPVKASGIVKIPDVTLKRAVIGRADLYDWLEAVRNGDRDQLKSVCLRLMKENRSETAQQWILHNARPMKYTGPSRDGKGTDLAIEALVLSAERITMKDYDE